MRGEALWEELATGNVAWKGLFPSFSLDLSLLPVRLL